jgi:hypothetical protein
MVESLAPAPFPKSSLDATKHPGTRRAFVLLLILTAVVVTPYAIRGLPSGHDVMHHLVWADAFLRQIAVGELYPRWLTHLGKNLGGSPAFFFYPPLPYFASSAFGILTLDPSRQVLGGAILSIWIGVIGTFLWLRHWFDARAAAVGSALYLLMPYHLLVDFATRTAYAELWALACLPWVLSSVDAAVDSRLRAVCFGALSTSLLLLSHPPTSVTFLPMAVAYSIYVALEARSAGPVLVSIASWCLGGGLAAVYLLPALTHGGFVQQQHMFSDHWYYGNWFFFYPPVMVDGQAPSFLFAVRRALEGDHRGFFKIIITAVTTAQIVLCWLGVAALRLLDYERKASAQLKLAVAFAVVASAYYFLNFRASDFLWARLPLLAHIQFPWRVNAELLLCGAMIGACLTSAISNRPRNGRGRIIAWVAAIGLAGVLVANIENSLHYAPVKQEEMTNILRNYVSPLEHVAPYRTSPAALFREGAQTVFVSGAGNATVAEWAARRIEIDVVAERPGTLAIAEQFYPGWSAVITPAGGQVTVDRLAVEYGILAVDVPAGRSRISLRLGWTPNERLGWQVSGVSGLILILMLSGDWLKRHHSRRHSQRQSGMPVSVPLSR